MTRLNRAGYFWRILGVSTIGQGIAFAGASINGNPNLHPMSLIEGALRGREEALIPLLALTLATGICMFFAARRFHDLDRSALNVFGLLVPIYNFYLGIVLLFRKGTAGGNSYGIDPLATAA